MRNRWCNQVGKGIDGLDSLVYASRLLGAEPELVLWGGGNSSAKGLVKDYQGHMTRFFGSREAGQI